MSKALAFGMVIALMGLSMTAIADEHEVETETVETESYAADYMEWLGNGRIVVHVDYEEFSIDFGDAEAPEDANHGTYASAIVHLLNDPDAWEGDGFDLDGDFDPSHYRLGCLVRQVAASEVGKDGADDPETYLSNLDLESCKKKQYVEDWEPPGKAKKGDDWEPPGKANAAAAKAKGSDTED